MKLQEALQIIEAVNRARQAIIAQTKSKTFEITLTHKGRKSKVFIQALGKSGAEAIAKKSLLGKIVKVQEVPD